MRTDAASGGSGVGVTSTGAEVAVGAVVGDGEAHPEIVTMAKMIASACQTRRAADAFTLVPTPRPTTAP